MMRLRLLNGHDKLLKLQGVKRRRARHFGDKSNTYWQNRLLDTLSTLSSTAPAAAAPCR